MGGHIASSQEAKRDWCFCRDSFLSYPRTTAHGMLPPAVRAGLPTAVNLILTIPQGHAVRHTSSVIWDLVKLITSTNQYKIVLPSLSNLCIWHVPRLWLWAIFSSLESPANLVGQFSPYFAFTNQKTRPLFYMWHTRLMVLLLLKKEKAMWIRYTL